MKDYVILTDSTTDLTPEQVEQMGIVVIPLEFTMEGKAYKNYLDHSEMSAKEFYRLVREGQKPITSQINMSQYMEIIEPILQSGKDALIAAFSSALSGTYQSAALAAEELNAKYPDSKVIAVDTRSASMGEGLLVHHIVQQKHAGLSIDELAQWILDQRSHLCHWFTVDDLNHLKRGGRVSATAALVGTFLGIKPVLHMDNEGRLIPMFKVRGRRQSLDALVDKMAETYDRKEPQTVFISHGDSLEDAEYVAKQVRSRLPVKEIIINYIGPVIGAHSGPGTIALFFMGSHR